MRAGEDRPEQVVAGPASRTALPAPDSSSNNPLAGVSTSLAKDSGERASRLSNLEGEWSEVMLPSAPNAVSESVLR